MSVRASWNRWPDLPTRGTDTADRDAQSSLESDEIAQSYWRLVKRGRLARTLALDLRPHIEAF